MLTPTIIGIHLTLHHTLQPTKLILHHAMMTRTRANHLLILIRIPTRRLLKPRAMSHARAQRRVVDPFAQKQRAAPELNVEAFRGDAVLVVEEMEEFAQVACVADDFGRAEQVEARVGRLDCAEKGLELVRVLWEARDEGCVVDVELDFGAAGDGVEAGRRAWRVLLAWGGARAW